MITEIEKQVMRLIQGDIPVHPRPFSVLAAEAGLSEQEFIDAIHRLKTRGIIRRFGATLRHQQAGFRSNAMVAWCVPAERIPKVGRILADFQEVTHCYQRRAAPDWPYNLYTMIHGGSREECREVARRMSASAGIASYDLLFSEQEFKKTSMEYF